MRIFVFILLLLPTVASAQYTLLLRALRQSGATTGQVIKWNGSQWAPANDSIGGGSGVTDGDKGDIDVASSGTVWTIDTAAVTNIKIADDAVTAGKIDNDAVGSQHIITNAVGSDELASTSVTPATYGDATNVAQFTVDADGRLTAASNVAITFPVGSVGAFNNTSTANGLSITGTALSLHAASATHPGGVSTGTQTFAGTKIFASKVGVGNVSPTAQLEIDAGSSFSPFIFSGYGTGSGSAYAKFANLTTTSFIGLSLGEQAGTGDLPLQILRYGSTHATKAREVEIRNEDNADLSIWTNANERLTVEAGGTVSVVNSLKVGSPAAGTGRTIVKGTGTTNASYAWQHYDSGNTEKSRIDNAGYYQGAGLGNVGYTYTGRFNMDARLFQPSSVNSAITSGGTSNIEFAGRFIPTSGTGEWSALAITGDINQAGGASGVTNGLLINNNLLSAPAYRGVNMIGGTALFSDGALTPFQQYRLNVGGSGTGGSTGSFAAFDGNGDIIFAINDNKTVSLGAAGLASCSFDGSQYQDGWRLPHGTTAQRPATPQNGMIRSNTTTNEIEAYTGGSWGGLLKNSTASPTQLVADNDNYNPTGFDAATVVRVSGDNGLRAITSMAAQSDGEQKLIVNVGSFAIYFPGEHPDGTAANRFDIDRDLFLLPKQSARAVYDATSARWRIWVEGSEPGRGKRADYYWAPGSVTAADHGQWTFNTGTGGVTTNASTVPDVGLNAVEIHTSTSATGVATALFVKNVATVGETGVNHIYGSALISLENLSTSGERFTFQHALTSGANGTNLDVNNSLGIRYRDDLNSGKFQLFTRNTSGTESTADSGVTVAADQAYELFCSVDKSLSEARFYINGTMVGRITTNLPATATGLGLRELIIKSVGTTQRGAYLHNMAAGAVNP